MLIGLLILSGVAWQQRPSGQLRLIAPVLPGDAFLIETPTGGWIVIDGGNDPNALASAVGQALPFWQRRIDILIQTSNQHLLAQLALLRRYEFGRSYVLPAWQPTKRPEYRLWQQIHQDHGIPIRRLHQGHTISLSDGVELRVVQASETGSLLVIRYRQQQIVLAHASDPRTDTPLPALTHAALLIFPWQRDPTIPFVQAQQPHVLLFSDGWQSKQPARMSMYQRRIGQARLLHEKIHGTVLWASDGSNAMIMTQP
jgi:hypothetical protein